MEAEDVPARAAAAGAAPRRRRSGGSPAWRRCGASACCSPPSCDRAATPRTSPPRALDAGLVVNAGHRPALRLAPPLLVTDDEIDEAVAILGEGAAP